MASKPEKLRGLKPQQSVTRRVSRSILLKERSILF
jgi:hypothetical protein